MTLRDLVRTPALHFVVLGAALFALVRGDGGRPGPDARPSIVLSADDVARLRETWTRVHGVPPGAIAAARLVDDAVDEEVLHREALALGVDRQDRAVRERLVRLGRFLGEEPARDDGTLEREARRLGLTRSDVVVRRHLVDMMRLAAGRPDDLPTEAELEEHLARHAGRFARPATVRLTHVYLSRDRRGEALAADAARLLDELRCPGADPAVTAARGDAFIRGSHIGPASHADLARVFGNRFADAVDGLEPGRWLGPVPSPFGVHLVRVDERAPGEVPSLGAVRAQVLHHLLRGRASERLETRLRTLRAQFEIRVPASGS